MKKEQTPTKEYIEAFTYSITNLELIRNYDSRRICGGS